MRAVWLVWLNDTVVDVCGSRVRATVVIDNYRRIHPHDNGWAQVPGKSYRWNTPNGPIARLELEERYVRL